MCQDAFPNQDMYLYFRWKVKNDISLDYRKMYTCFFLGAGTTSQLSNVSVYGWETGKDAHLWG